MSKKEIKPLDRIDITGDMRGYKVHLYYLCPTCLQEVKQSWSSCQYCDQPLTDNHKGNNK